MLLSESVAIFGMYIYALNGRNSKYFISPFRIFRTAPDPHTVFMQDISDGRDVDAEFLADIHRPHVGFIHFEDALCQGFSLGGFVGNLDAGLLQCPADGAPMASKFGRQFISAGSCTVLLCDLPDFVIGQTFLFLRISIDFGTGIIGDIGHIRVDFGIAGMKGSIVLCPVFEDARGRVVTVSL